jgi:glycosyltransferase 2 family protein
VFLTIVAYRIWGSNFDWSLFVASFANLQPGWLAASVLATFLTYVSRAFRWQILLNPLKTVATGRLISTNVLGFSAIFVLGRAGELVRPIWLTRLEQIPFTASVATILVERFLDTTMVIVMFAAALLLVKIPATAGQTLVLMKNAAWVMVAISVGAMVVLFVFRSNIDRIVRSVRIARLATIITNFSHGLTFLRRGRSLAMVLAHSVVLWILVALQFWFMLLGMNLRFTVQEATLVMVGAAIGSIAQIPGIGGGFQAGYVLCMTTFFMVPAEQAIATSLVAWILSNVPTMFMGVLYMISHGLSLKDLRTAEVAE